ncbi:ubiquitin carboxyl-terminal hydrolase isozyme L3-like isoform X2 [Oscarella lobularis]|uniref:ubiquitin carboxyl-terminal hydrolase isozyme L3-like isoform X2 n=1 Tax=Oscarella lobularis TaxID=121494 RepID=UPI00331416D2
MSRPHWIPLESNPEVVNKFVFGMGMKPSWQFHDVFGLDPDLLAMIPQPACALMLLFPVNEKHRQHKSDEDERLKKEEQHVSKNVYFMKQNIGNACGTIGVLHAIANNQDVLDFDDGYLKTFLAKTKDMSAEKRAEYLETDESISDAHEASAQEGQTAAPQRDESVDLHFIAFVHKDGHIYELDGTKSFPINHGKSSSETFLKDAAKVCQSFMERDPGEMRFTIMALAKA